MSTRRRLAKIFRHDANSRQRGATLITALVMLVVLTLLVISAIRSSTTNLRIAGNMQVQEEVVSAAQQATEVILSSDFTQGLPASSIPIDINNDGVVDYTANITAPTCSGDTPLTNSSPSLPPQCVTSGATGSSLIVNVSGPPPAAMSWCDAQQWDLDTTVSDPRTGAGETLHQGVSMIVPAGTPCTVALPNSP